MSEIETITENKEALFKYNKDVVWSLPVLCRYEPIWGAIYKCLQKIDINIPTINAFGSPTNLWAGGRIPVWVGEFDKATLKATFNYLKSVNATPSLTFTCTSLQKEDLNDRYANYLLDIALEAGAHFIIYSDYLRDYIKEKDSNAYVVASVIKAYKNFHDPATMKHYEVEKETEFYNKLLKEYDMVVVRPEYSKNVLVNNPEVIDDIKRIEVLINQPCVMNCSRAIAHYTHMEKFRNRKNNDGNFSEFRCLKQDIHFKDIYQNLASLDENLVRMLVDAGVRHLKIQGRGDNNGNQAQALMFFGQMFKITGAPYIIVEELMQYATDSEVGFFAKILEDATEANTVIHF